MLNTIDTPGAIGVIGTICGKHNINLSDILQKGSQGGKAEVVIITGLCNEGNIKDALDEMKKSNVIEEVKSLIRVMN